MEVKYQNTIMFLEIEPTSRDGRGYLVTVEPEGAVYETDKLFTEYTFITGPAIRMKYNEAQLNTLNGKLLDYTLSKAKARIALGLYENGREYKQEITTATLRAELKLIEDSIIQKWILTGLLNLRKKNPLEYQNERIDVEGFCAILAISKDQYLFNASVLLEDSYIKEGEISEVALENGKIFITSKGIKYLKSMEKEKNKITKEEGREDLPKPTEYEYDVAITFAGEDRKIAEELAKVLRAKNINVFYDDFEKADLWGKNLYEHLSYIYGKAARYCLMLLSKNYAQKAWTNLERQSAQARAFREKTEYILPIRLDDTEIPGLPETVGYITLKDNPIPKIADLVYKKIIKI